MIAVLDASALFAVLVGEAGAEAAAAAAAGGGVVTAVNLAEVRDKLLRRSASAGAIDEAVQTFVDRGIRVLACDRPLAERAANLRAEHYHRRDRPVSLADCWALSAAEQVAGTLVSSDADQLRVAVLEGISIHPIANSAGVVAAM